MSRRRVVVGLLGALLIAAPSVDTPAFAQSDVLVLGGHQVGPLKIGGSFHELAERLGPTALVYQHGHRLRVYWERLGLVIAVDGDDIIMAYALVTPSVEPAAAAVLAEFRTPEGIRLGDTAQSLEQRLGVPYRRAPYPLEFPRAEQPAMAVRRWFYSAHGLYFDMVQDRVMGIGVFAPIVFAFPPDKTDTRIVAGQRIGPILLGDSSEAVKRYFGMPTHQKAREGGGLTILWRRGPTSFVVDLSKGFDITAMTLRYYKPNAGRVHGQTRLFVTDAGLRIGDPVKQVTAALGTPRERSAVAAEFRPDLAADPVVVPLERWHYDGLMVEVAEGVVWGLGVAAPSAAPRP